MHVSESESESESPFRLLLNCAYCYLYHKNDRSGCDAVRHRIISTRVIPILTIILYIVVCVITLN